MDAIKKKYPIRDENNQPSAYPTFASQVFFEDGTVLEGKNFGGGDATIDLLDIYPVGSIYISSDWTSPASLFGGAWEQLKDRFLLGAGDTYALGSKGGEAAVSLTVENNGPHGHAISGAGSIYYQEGGKDMWINLPTMDTGYTTTTTTSGSGTPHNNMPPYLAVCMWKRVS